MRIPVESAHVSDPIVVPERLIQTNARGRGEAGRAWTERLPAIVSDCAARWGLTIEGHYPGLAINYAVRVRLADGQAAVLKAGFPGEELARELFTLRAFDGDGAVRVLAADEPNGALLLERLEPGTLLASEPDDEKATAVAAGLLRRLNRPVAPGHPLPTHAERVALAAAQSRADMARRGEREPAWLARALAVHAELIADHPPQLLLHGDFHHLNVLAAEREPWLAIDPHGAVGEPGDEVGPWLENRAERWPRGDAAARRHLVRLIAQLAAALGVDAQRLTRLAFVRVALSEMWTLEGEGPNEPARFERNQLRCLRLLASLV